VSKEGTTKFYAQFGEDCLLAEHFAHKPDGYFVEVGAYDGVEMSNTLYFEQNGWTGLLVEADPELAQECRRNRPGSLLAEYAAVALGTPKTITFTICDDARGLSSIALDDSARQRVEAWAGRYQVREVTVQTKTLDAILEENAVTTIDFMTLDVEEHEWDVLSGFTISRWKPTVLLIERNTRFPDRRIMDYLHRNGYTYLRTTGVNDWFLLSAPGVSKSLAYRWRLFRDFYLPKHREQWREEAEGKNASKKISPVRWLLLMTYWKTRAAAVQILKWTGQYARLKNRPS
jgi:FkbM family methyltransferase